MKNKREVLFPPSKTESLSQGKPHFKIYSLPQKTIINPQILTNVCAVTKERWQQQMLRADGSCAGCSGEGRAPFIYLFIYLNFLKYNINIRLSAAPQPVLGCGWTRSPLQLRKGCPAPASARRGAPRIAGTQPAHGLDGTQRTFYFYCNQKKKKKKRQRRPRERTAGRCSGDVRAPRSSSPAGSVRRAGSAASRPSRATARVLGASSPANTVPGPLALAFSLL